MGMRPFKVSEARLVNNAEAATMPLASSSSYSSSSSSTLTSKPFVSQSQSIPSILLQHIRPLSKSKHGLPRYPSSLSSFFPLLEQVHFPLPGLLRNYRHHFPYRRHQLHSTFNPNLPTTTRFFSYTRSSLLTSSSHLRFPNSSSPTSSSSEASSADSNELDLDADKSLTGRLKTLTRKYGWATVVVYLFFSVVDFSIIFFTINLIGADHVRQAQDYVLDVLVYGRSRRPIMVDGQESSQGNGILGFLKDWRENHKLKEHAEDANHKAGGSGGMWATAVAAYTIHKTLLLPFRIGATAAATPAIVK